MYADRHAGTDRFGAARFSPTGLAGAIGINVAVVAALMVAAPLVVAPPPRVDPPIDTYNVPPPPEPAPEPLPRSDARPAPRPDAPRPKVAPPAPGDWTVTADPLPLPPDNIDPGTGTAPEPADLPTPTPVIVAPGVDPRFAGDFQPTYPPSERRADREGKVTVRVLIGADGRVKRVERVSATSDAFFRVTEQRALARWRFRPGTRGGVAQEAWRTMTVTFVLSD